MGSSSSSYDSNSSCSVGGVFSAVHEIGKKGYAVGSKVGEVEETVLGELQRWRLHLKQEV
ncbi:hypothetical protein [Bartonella raoultii]|uniref:hypothetical protein n=1 Tax=Bartonella raoultii TaxID=1457020 RepID=UPI001ABA6A76|nr:hypothetical protein [Bartonella raoultii]